MDRDAETLRHEAPSDGRDVAKDTGPRAPAPQQTRDPGRYEIIAEHGRGGIGRVLRATDREFGRDVALKELLIRTSMSEQRFMREALITARLEHPNIVPVHEAGRWPDGTPFYAMKLVSGRPLKALIDQARTRADRLALLDRVLDVTDAIAYAHARGVIHRDLKPSNIIVGDYGETIVIDWGLAKLVSDPVEDTVPSGGAPTSSPELTTAGSVLGTPAYMAPEQAAAGRVDERSDVYALGAILLDVLGGKAARTTATASAEASGVTTESGVAAPRTREIHAGVPADLLSIAWRATAQLPDDRYPNAKAFGDDLRRFLAALPVDAHRYTARERATRWFAAHRRLVQGATAVLVALLVASVWFLARESRLRGAAESARTGAEEARRIAEIERQRADRQTLALLEQQGRTVLNQGHPFQAAPILVEAYRRDPRSAPVRWLLSESLRALDALTIAFDVAPPNQPDDTFTYTVSLSPDDRELVTGQEASLGFWDPSTGALRRRVRLPWYGNQARHSGDGARLFMLIGERAGDAPARALDTGSGQEVAAVPVGAAIDWVSWSPDGRYVAAVADPGRVDVWSVSPPRVLFSFQGAPHPVYGCMAISPDGSLLAARGTAELILVSLATRAIRRFPTPGEDVRALAFAPDSRRLLTTMGDRSVRIWDVATGRVLGKLRQHVGPPYIAVFSGDGSMIATVDSEALHLWDVSSTIRLASLALQTSDETYSAAFAHHAPRLVTTTSEGRIRVWDLPRDRWARHLPEHRGRVRAAYVADGTRILTLDEGEGSGRLRTWNASDGRLERSTSVAWNPACGIDVSPDGGRVALLSPDGRPTIVETSSGNVLLRLDVGAEQINHLAFSPDGRQLATASEKGIVRLWSTEDGAPTALTLREPRQGRFSTVEFSPDGARILTSSTQGITRAWDSSSGTPLQALKDSMGFVADYSGDGRRIITGGWGGEYVPRIWDARTGQPVAKLEGHGPLVYAAALSRDGTLAATAGTDGLVKISDAATGALLRTIGGPTDVKVGGNLTPVHTVAFSPDGTRLLTSSAGYVLIWNIELDPRSPAEAAAVVEAKSPWRLIDGRLSLGEP